MESESWMQAPQRMLLSLHEPTPRNGRSQEEPFLLFRGTRASELSLIHWHPVGKKCVGKLEDQDTDAAFSVSTILQNELDTRNLTQNWETALTFPSNPKGSHRDAEGSQHLCIWLLLWRLVRLPRDAYLQLTTLGVQQHRARTASWPYVKGYHRHL